MSKEASFENCLAFASDLIAIPLKSRDLTVIPRRLGWRAGAVGQKNT